MTAVAVEKLLRDRLGLNDTLADEVANEARTTGQAVEDVLVRRGLVRRDEFYDLLAGELNVPFIDVSNYTIEPGLLALVPADLARRLRVLPLFNVAGTLTVALTNPTDINVLDELRQALNVEVSPVLADPQALQEAINAWYPARDATSEHRAARLEHAVREATDDEALTKDLDDARNLEELASEAPVVRLVNELIEKALAVRASDIHIEPDEDRMHVRIRVDGVLRENEQYPARLHPAVSSRVKILCGLDISEKRRPQDGRFNTRLGDRDVDARVSTFPTVFGENVVIRLLDKTAGPVAVRDLGMAETDAARFESLIARPHGIILVTGPTGSGKTTTLYSALGALNTVDRNIITLEDPVEYRLPLVRHCQINPRAGVTFASGLRAILRQDPDIIMVGEIRDSETAEIAFQAALTGHLVLSTLHTNDAASALTRLADMGVEPFLISSSVLAILAQRLVRRNCEKCGRPEPLPESVRTRLGAEPGEEFVRGPGCSSCSSTGYRGRVGIYELLTLSPDIRDLVMAGRSSEEIKSRALTEGMSTLRSDALDKARTGLTSAEEVLRVTPAD
ncbi:MAG TPA: type II/IV secretion system protein [candidate division WOR-3 bacterium]|uniref:Type II/IV secretion system protein n=1 Tax=candidate division WOR-3 bacterium TaxID=2052148 RepID=A0A7V0T742_UNCW3|nr:type II/IV secretion system protein [candidate division WOR-3 bacterium]